MGFIEPNKNSKVKGLHYFKNIYIGLAIMVTVLIFGMIGFITIENYSLGEAFFMTIITVSTVGFTEVRPLTNNGMFFTSILIIISMGSYAYVISIVTGYIVSGEFTQYFKNYKVNNKINKLENHVIVCGYGRNGKEACANLEKNGISYLTIEGNSHMISQLREEQKILYVEGDSTNENILKEAGIDRARALITTLPKDADNVFVVLTAREMNPKLKIISRASEDASVNKLRRAGADNVIMPDKIGGSHMASLITKPDVLEFLDYLTLQVGETIILEEILVNKLSSEFHNKSIRELKVKHLTGINIIGFKTQEGKFIINPDPEIILQVDAKIFVLGTQEQVAKLMGRFAV